jgi:hypothetical protein
MVQLELNCLVFGTSLARQPGLSVLMGQLPVARVENVVCVALAVGFTEYDFRSEASELIPKAILAPQSPSR